MFRQKIGGHTRALFSQRSLSFFFLSSFPFSSFPFMHDCFLSRRQKELKGNGFTIAINKHVLFFSQSPHVTVVDVVSEHEHEPSIHPICRCLLKLLFVPIFVLTLPCSFLWGNIYIFIHSLHSHPEFPPLDFGRKQKVEPGEQGTERGSLLSPSPFVYAIDHRGCLFLFSFLFSLAQKKVNASVVQQPNTTLCDVAIASVLSLLFIVVPTC